VQPCLLLLLPAAAAPRAREAAIQLTAQAMDRGEIALSVGSDAASACHVLSAVAAPPGVPSQAVIKVPHELRPTKVKGMFMSIPEVKAVVPNRVVRIAQAFTAGERASGCSTWHCRQSFHCWQLQAGMNQLCVAALVGC
jgi:hypothetical protein